MRETRSSLPVPLWILISLCLALWPALHPHAPALTTDQARLEAPVPPVLPAMLRLGRQAPLGVSSTQAPELASPGAAPAPRLRPAETLSPWDDCPLLHRHTSAGPPRAPPAA